MRLKTVTQGEPEMWQDRVKESVFNRLFSIIR